MLNPEFGLSLLDRLFRLVPWCTPYAPEHCQKVCLAEGGKQAETAVANSRSSFDILHTKEYDDADKRVIRMRPQRGRKLFVEATVDANANLTSPRAVEAGERIYSEKYKADDDPDTPASI